MLADRYRIVALAGRGGMGEVYRADDLKLGQTVALKFLPEAVAQDGAALARFHREVRIARQVSHASVCRVFDIGDIEGLPFLTMEYVDGEDLAALMRRIGRLSPDKALEIARQICAGLAAAHEHGILHRDLKPANIMLDGRGKARITDFGLAGLADELREEDVRAGTPAYMAPEQLAGQEVSAKSDIYALGLVLYELFTGKRAYEATSMKELVRLREQGTLSSPSSVAKDVDPLVERVVLRCLEKDPAKRPATALQVAAALPGGDPLAAALAAGETPSPEMVAAAGETEGLRPSIGWGLLAATAVLAALTIVMAQRIKLFRYVAYDKPPEVLAERAREIEKKVGYTAAPVDIASGFGTDTEVLQYIGQHNTSPSRWQNLDRGEAVFWYRESPRPLEASDFFKNNMMMGMVTPEDPVLHVSGMTLVWLTTQGSLIAFYAVPPQVEEIAAQKSAPPDWSPLFAAAGFDITKWTPAEPKWTPNTFCDARAAWTGVRPDHPDEPLRVEAAAYRGRPVFFLVIGPWTRPGRMQAFQASAGQRAANVILFLLFVGLIGGAALCARYNLRQGRGDRRGAARLAGAVFTVMAVAWILGASHVANFYELGLFLIFVSWALFVSGLLWTLYIALEPFVRRLWPTTIISWSRLLAGGWRDPLVGRDILAGCLAGVTFSFLGDLQSVLPSWFGHPPPQPDTFPAELLLGARHALSTCIWQAVIQLFFCMAVLFVLLFFRWVLRREWLAAAALVLVMSAPGVLQTDAPPLFRMFGVLVWVVLAFVLLRYGLVALTAAFFVSMLIDSFPITTDTSAWYAGVGYSALFAMAALAFYGLRTALAGKPMFGDAQPG